MAFSVFRQTPQHIKNPCSNSTSVYRSNGSSLLIFFTFEKDERGDSLITKTSITNRFLLGNAPIGAALNCFYCKNKINISSTRSIQLNYVMRENKGVAGIVNDKANIPLMRKSFIILDHRKNEPNLPYSHANPSKKENHINTHKRD